jgi:hypothetical protein
MAVVKMVIETRRSLLNTQRRRSAMSRSACIKRLGGRVCNSNLSCMIYWYFFDLLTVGWNDGNIV